MESKQLRILDFDIENRPLAYLGQDYTTAEITAIAACFVGEPKTMTCWLLGVSDPIAMLDGFRQMYNAADIVTGHYIREHDLPIINGAMVEYGLSSLDQKMTSDTKLDLTSMKYLSASQENLCTMLGILKAKAHLNNAEWREANRLTPRGFKLTAKRAMGDVVQHMVLRRVLIERNLLSAPKVWQP